MVIPATFVAAVALFVALGGGAYAAVQSISGGTITPNSIPENRLTKAAIAALSGQILTYDATAVVGAPSPKIIGTVLGDTFAAACVNNSGNAELVVYLKTSDGSWSADGSIASSDGFANAGLVRYPAGTLSTLHTVDTVDASAGSNASDFQFDWIQLGPQAGSLEWHESAITTSTPSASCHVSIEAFPSPLTKVSAAVLAQGRSTLSLPLRFSPSKN